MSSVFTTLNDVDVSDKIKEKGGLSYLSWASAWAEVKKRYPDAEFRVYPQTIDEHGNDRFWHDDGKTGWVEVGVTIDDIEMIEVLPIMDFKNKAIPADAITSTDANKTMKRCLVKACALHGLGLYVYDSEDLPESVSKSNEIKDHITALIKKKCDLGEAATKRVSEYCKAAERKAWPELDDDAITGRNYKDIDDVDILTNLEKQLMAVRK